MKNFTQKIKGFLSLFLLTAFIVNALPASAQEMVISDDFVSGSSAFVFKSSRKSFQKKVASRPTTSVKRTKTAKVETSKRIAKQNVTVAKVSPKRQKTKEIDPVKQKVDTLIKTKSSTEASVIFAGVGEYYLNTNEPDSAIEAFRESVLLNEKNATAKLGLSEALTRKGDQQLTLEKYEIAKLFYQEAMTNNPKNAFALAGLAEIAGAKDDNDTAITNYEKALALDADLTELYAPLGAIYFQKGEIAKSEFYLQKAVALDGNNAETQFFIGLVRYKQNRNEEAIAFFKKSLLLDPNNSEAHYFLGEVYDRQDRDKEAIAAYRKAVELNPKYVDAWFDLGAAYYNRATDQGPNSIYYEESVKAYKEVVKLRPTYGEAYANLADVYRQMKRLDESIAAYRLATAYIKDDAELFSKFGFVAALRAKDPNFQSFWKLAIDNLEKAVALSPSYIDYTNLGWAYYNAAQTDLRARREADYKDKLQKARMNFEKSISLNPAIPAPFLNLGMALTDLGDFQGAINALKKASEMQKNWIPALSELGIAYRKNGDFENAAKQFRRVIELDDKFAAAHYNLAETEYRRGNIKEAKKEYEILKKLNRPDLVLVLEQVTNGGIKQ